MFALSALCCSINFTIINQDSRRSHFCCFTVFSISDTWFLVRPRHNTPFGMRNANAPSLHCMEHRCHPTPQFVLYISYPCFWLTPVNLHQPYFHSLRSCGRNLFSPSFGPCSATPKHCTSIFGSTTLLISRHPLALTTQVPFFYDTAFDRPGRI